MAKLFIRGREPLSMDDKTAKSISVDWIADPKSSNIVDFSGEIFKLSDIKSISMDSDEGRDYSTNRINLDNDTDRKMVKDFEKEFLDWYKKDGQEYKDSLICFSKFMEMKGALKLDEGWEYPGDETIINSNLYEEITRLWSSLQDLRRRRTKAENEELEKTAQSTLGEL